MPTPAELEALCDVVLPIRVMWGGENEVSLFSETPSCGRRGLCSSLRALLYRSGWRICIARGGGYISLGISLERHSITKYHSVYHSVSLEHDTSLATKFRNPDK